MPLENLMQLTREVDFSLAAHEPLLLQSIAALSEYPVQTRADRLQLQQAYLELTASYLKNYLGYPREYEVLQVRKEIQEAHQLLYADHSMGVRCHTFLCTLQQALKHAEYEECLSLISSSFHEIATWDYPSSPGHDALVQRLIVHIQSLLVLIQFTEQYPDDPETCSPIEQAIADVFIQFQETGFIATIWLELIEKVRVQLPEVSENKNVQPLLLCYGMLIYFDPEYSPLLENLENEFGEEIIDYLKHLQSTPAIVSNENKQPSRQEILLHYRSTLQQEGFSEHALYEVMAQVRAQLESEKMSLTDYAIFVEQLRELSKPYAPVEMQETLEEVQQGLKAMIAFVDAPPEEVNEDELSAEMDVYLHEMSESLKKGRSVSAAITRTLNGFQLVALKIGLLPDPSMEFISGLMKTFFNALMQAVEKHVPENMRAFFPQVQQFVKQITQFMDQLEGPEWKKELALQQVEDSTHRFMNAVNFLPVHPDFENNAMVKQFVELFPQLSARLVNLSENLFGEDARELQRIQAAREDTMNLLKSAYTLQQLIQHQQFGLRQIAYDLGQFERRNLLYFTPCALPVHDVIVHVNQVFFSGQVDIQNKVQEACSQLGLHMATQKSNTTSLENRWQQIRESGLCIFDFSSYQPGQADPPDFYPGIPSESAALQTASPIATVAFECGWALSLGKPLVIVTGSDQLIPFDIDIHPCAMQGDLKDPDRLVQAIQIALYGKPRISDENILYLSRQFLFEKASESNVVAADEIRAGIEQAEGDATLLKQLGKRLFDYLPAQNHYAIQAPFASCYPDSEGAKKVFHVTAFRSWSRSTEEHIRATCQACGLDYLVGYEQIDPDILAAIWKDITRAHFVIADITLLNPNAVLELGMAMALGKPTLIIHQHAFIQKYFSPLSKIRTHTYSNEGEGGRQFRQVLQSFFHHSLE